MSINILQVYEAFRKIKSIIDLLEDHSGKKYNEEIRLMIFFIGWIFPSSTP
jgi:hypothetical protein